ncbi:glycosyltransferase family 2 protein [Kineothrix sp. MB12-C1]|uniref:glycosyltransferase family 2 protein n=1 Tax=Kineothrix sp. MB12-C1 TaxID=3070215 RepID=UPI0027D33E80|nr:glycosyltransferase family 2 protein [Kineothrix sp. MB12-C1]WMC93866.1 glycosyltransferase family 2 protein [Kineothrix sp. MB12-C1]
MKNVEYYDKELIRMENNTKMDVKVSIIIPIYNMGKYLCQCLNSILNQTLKEIEVICVNDGSTDDSSKILAEYQGTYSNMIILTQANSGSGPARNNGLKMAGGEYVMFVDPDDFLVSDDALEILYYKALKEQVLVCGGNVVKYFDGVFSNKFLNKQRKIRFDREERLLFKDYQYPYVHARYIISRKLLLDNDISYPSYRRGQDPVFLVRVLICAEEFYAIDKDVYAYRVRHKEEKFSPQKAEDFINAMIDTMVMALNNELIELFNLISRDLNEFAKTYLYTILLNSDKWELVFKVNEILNKGMDLFGEKVPIEYLMNKEEYMLYLKRLYREREECDTLLQKNKEIVIYGAGLVGKKTCQYLKNKGIIPRYFVVSNKSQNVDNIEGIPIISIQELEHKEDMLIVIGVITDYKDDVKKTLGEYGFDNILDFDHNILNISEDYETSL